MECIVKILDSHPPVSPVDIKIQRRSSPAYKIHSDDLEKTGYGDGSVCKVLAGQPWGPELGPSAPV